MVLGLEFQVRRIGHQQSLNHKFSKMATPAPLANFQRKGRVNRILKKLEPQLVENTKRALIIKGMHTSQSIVDVLKDFSKLLKPNCKVLGRKNELVPFEDGNSLEFLATKNDCSLFIVGSHSKKRTNNLVMGRTFDGHVLDMIEFGVDAHVSIDSLPGSKKAVGSKPVVLFLGDQWESDTQYTRIQNLLLDFFRGDKIDMISLKGVDHVIACTAFEGKILLRTYAVGFRKSGTKIPEVVLTPMGAYMDLSVRRTQVAADDIFKGACRKPKSVKPPKIKNITKTVLGETVGRIHMKRQNFDRMAGRKVAALREKRTITEDPDSGSSKGGKRRKIG